MTRFVCISDTHGDHDKIPELPWGNVLIHAGDFTGWGTLADMNRFAIWMGQQEHEIKIAIAGNHDEAALDYNIAKMVFGNQGIIYLDGSYTMIPAIGGSRILKAFGTPYTPEFCGWHFMEYEHELAVRYSNIPDDTDILICHGPPRGILDESPQWSTMEWSNRLQREVVVKKNLRVGSTALAHRIKQLPDLKLVVCGHIHYGRGILHQDGVVYVNAASLGENYEPVKEEPIVIDL